MKLFKTNDMRLVDLCQDLSFSSAKYAFTATNKKNPLYKVNLYMCVFCQ